MWMRGLAKTIQRLRHSPDDSMATYEPDEAPAPPVAESPAAVVPGVLDDFHDARLVDRRDPGRHRNLPIDAPSHVQARALEDVLKAIETMMAELGLEDTPRDIVITTRREFQILRFLEDDPATYLFARLGREGVALPEARLRVKDLEVALGA